jgi:hypothetical protein
MFAPGVHGPNKSVASNAFTRQAENLRGASPHLSRPTLASGEHGAPVQGLGAGYERRVYSHKLRSGLGLTTSRVARRNAEDVKEQEVALVAPATSRAEGNVFVFNFVGVPDGI